MMWKRVGTPALRAGLRAGAPPPHLNFVGRLQSMHGLQASTPLAMLTMNTMKPAVRTAPILTMESAFGKLPFFVPRSYPLKALREMKVSAQSLLRRFRDLNVKYPFAMGFAVCFGKGIVADILAQKCIAKKQEIDKRQVLAVGLFSGCFTGCAYHYLFNVVFARVFGCAKNLSTVIKKAAADGCFIFPFLYMPFFYFSDHVVRLGKFEGVGARWYDEIGTAMNSYYKIWPATMICCFSVVPVELRVSFIAGVSFVWLVILSAIAH